MAIIDAQLMYSDAQALTASAASTNVVDHSSDRNLGIGEPLAAVVSIDVALGGGGSNTLAVAIQTDDNSSFSSATTVVSSPTYTSLAAGAQIVLTIPAGTEIERYTRLNYTAGGTTPTCTVTAELRPLSFVSTLHAYPDAIVIS